MARPPSSVPLHRVHIQLPAEDVELFKVLGGGQLSAGVRHAAGLIRRMGANASPGLDSDPVSKPEPKPKAHTKATAPAQASDVVRATATPKPATNILDLPLPFPKPIVYDDGDGVMDLDGMTSEEIERELAQNRADAERAERKQEAYKAAANGQGALIAPKGADDGDDDYDPYSPENLPEHLR